MKYLMYNIVEFKESINRNDLNIRCRKLEKDFSRKQEIRI